MNVALIGLVGLVPAIVSFIKSGDIGHLGIGLLTLAILAVLGYGMAYLVGAIVLLPQKLNPFFSPRAASTFARWVGYVFAGFGVLSAALLATAIVFTDVPSFSVSLPAFFLGAGAAMTKLSKKLGNGMPKISARA